MEPLEMDAELATANSCDDGGVLWLHRRPARESSCRRLYEMGFQAPCGRLRRRSASLAQKSSRDSIASNENGVRAYSVQ